MIALSPRSPEVDFYMRGLALMSKVYDVNPRWLLCDKGEYRSSPTFVLKTNFTKAKNHSWPDEITNKIFGICYFLVTMVVQLT